MQITLPFPSFFQIELSGRIRYPKTMLKKFICIFLLIWLPLFISAASAASLQMTMANLNAEMQNNMADVPPCHQHASDAQENSSSNNKVHNKQHHICNLCGFCLVASGFANVPHALNVLTTDFTSSQPAFFTAVFHSQTYPPAIKPPILH